MQKKSPTWKREICDAGRILLQKMLLGNKKELNFVLDAIQGKDFNVTLALLIHHLSVMTDKEETLRDQ